jgi:hypothetical protein
MGKGEENVSPTRDQTLSPSSSSLQPSLYIGQVVLALIKLGSYTYENFPVLCGTYYSQNPMTEAHNTAFSPMSGLHHQGSVYMSKWFSTPTFFYLWECNTKAVGTKIQCYLPVFTIPHNENKTQKLNVLHINSVLSTHKIHICTAWIEKMTKF